MPLVTFEAAGRTAVVTLNDPERLNAMSAPMGAEFAALFKKIAKDKTLRAVVLKGAGRAFSSGGNLDMITGMFGKPKATITKQLKTFYKMFLIVRDIPQIVIAAINGPAVGAGFCLAMACDMRFAAASAKMGANFAKIGLAPGMAGTSLMTKLTGPVRAAEILFTGRLFDAAQAERYGLLNEAVNDADLLERAGTVAREIADNAPLPLAQIKKGIQLAQTKTLEQMFDYDARMQAICLNTEDIQEGIAAAREKRPARFTGK
jgi:enoyl-CoA hydratase